MCGHTRLVPPCTRGMSYEICHERTFSRKAIIEHMFGIIQGQMMGNT